MSSLKQRHRLHLQPRLHLQAPVLDVRAKRRQELITVRRGVVSGHLDELPEDLQGRVRAQRVADDVGHDDGLRLRPHEEAAEADEHRRRARQPVHQRRRLLYGWAQGEDHGPCEGHVLRGHGEGYRGARQGLREEGHGWVA